MFTSLPGTTTTRRIVLPAVWACTFASARAASSGAGAGVGRDGDVAAHPAHHLHGNLDPRVRDQALVILGPALVREAPRVA